MTIEKKLQKLSHLTFVLSLNFDYIFEVRDFIKYKDNSNGIEWIVLWILEIQICISNQFCNEF